MIAKKENARYRITEAQKGEYLSAGFDIYNDDGGVLVERSPSATVPYRQYQVLMQENAKLKKQIAELKQKPTRSGK